MIRVIPVLPVTGIGSWFNGKIGDPMRLLLCLLLSICCFAFQNNPAFCADKAAEVRQPRLQIINGSSQPIDVFWLKSDSERVPNGTVEAGQQTTITTTLGHRFAVVGRQDKTEAIVTSEVVIQGFRFDPETSHKAPRFYTQSTSANGLPIVASKNVNPYALKEAEFLVNMMLARRPDVLKAMVSSGARLCIIAHNEFTTDLPEFARLGEGEAPGPNMKRFSAKDFWDARARGTGGSDSDPYCSCGEENLLGYDGDPYSTECILIHEIAHNIHLRGLQNVDPTFDKRLKECYRKAMDAGLWKGKYASVNHHEYFAEGVQSWFDNNRENDHDHNHVNTRAELLEYDPGLAAICREVFGDTELKYTKPVKRLKDHLQGYDPAKSPKFVWPERLAAIKVAIRQGAEARNQDSKPNPLLSVERIFRTSDFQEERLPSIVWNKRSGTYFTLESAAEKGEGRDLVRVDAATGNKEVLIPAQAFIPADAKKPLGIDKFEFSADESKLLIYTNSQRVWRQNTRGDYWIMDVASRSLKKLGGEIPEASMMFAKFSPDASRVAFVSKNNLYVQKLSDMTVAALTKDGSAHLINGTADWVNEEELEIRDGYRWSPDGETIAYWQFDTTGVPEFFMIDNTAGTHSKTIGFAYPKVGGQNSAARIGLVPAAGGDTRWIDLPGDSRNHYIARMEWTPDSRKIILQQFNRLQNTNRVFLHDVAGKASKTVHTETDDCWIENENPVRWLNEGREFLWISERDGWRHAYVAGLNGEPLRLLTQGEFDVLKIEAVDEKAGFLYFTASPDNPTQSYLYRVSLKGGPMQRLTPANQPGSHSYSFSPDAEFAVHTFSTITSPPVVNLVKSADHSTVRSLAENKKLREALAALKPTTTEFLRLDIGDNTPLDAWFIKPPQVDANQKLPLVVYVYGEPHGQTVRDSWQGGRGLWHMMLVQQGYVVASIDNRGTMSPRGRAWRKSVYRQIGIQAPKDQAAAVRSLLQRYPFIDAGRVGIWGWSGGGSMSLNAIFRYPDLYRTAISIAPVADQLLYDTIYQERYMGLPTDNGEGYRNGSPITHCAQLKGNLLLIHGTGDDNCHYQGTEKLMNELIAQNKQFSLMAYPGRSHSISEGRNTTAHLYGLMADFFQKSLMPVPGGKSSAADSQSTSESGK